MRGRKRKGWRKVINGVNISAFFIVLFTVLPLYWLIVSSFKIPSSMGDSPPQYFPDPVSGGNYSQAFVQYHFGSYFIHSVIVTLSATALVLILGTPAGYALGRLPMRGKFTLMVMLLMISLIPEIALIAPLYALMRTIHLLNSYQALIIPYTAFCLPFAIWILRNYMLAIPKETEETARIDGAGPIRTVWSVILPMALPGVFTAGILTFTACWTEFLMALTLDISQKTIPVGIATFGTPQEIPFETIFAASVVAVIPISVLVFIFRKSVISGLASGAVRG